MCQQSPFIDHPLHILPWASNQPASRMLSYDPDASSNTQEQEDIRLKATAAKITEQTQQSRDDTVRQLQKISKAHAVSFVAETLLPTIKGGYRIRAYKDMVNQQEIMCVIYGNIEGKENIPVRVHD